MIWYYIIIIVYLLIILCVGIMLLHLLFGDFILKYWTKFKMWLYFKWLDL